MIDQEATERGRLAKILCNELLVGKGLHHAETLGLLNFLAGVFVNRPLRLREDFEGLTVGVVDELVEGATGDGGVDLRLQLVGVFGFGLVLTFTELGKERVNLVQVHLHLRIQNVGSVTLCHVGRPLDKSEFRGRRHSRRCHHRLHSGWFQTHLFF